METVTQEQVLAALRNVQDPELHRDIVSLGMVKDLAVANGNVAFTVELTTPACPLRESIEGDCKKALAAVPGVSDLKITFGCTSARQQDGRRTNGFAADRQERCPGGCGKRWGREVHCRSQPSRGIEDARRCYRLLDADIYGPSVPIMMGVRGEPSKVEVNGGYKIAPTVAHGVPVMSIGFFLDADQAVIWRGPMLGKALHQLMADVHWGDLDYLVVDMPPGTGDVQITFSQQLKVSGALLVATPQEVALADVIRAKTMFDK